MEFFDVALTSAALDVTLRLVELAVRSTVPIAIFLAGRQIARAQYMKLAQDAWNEVNKAVIANPDLGKEYFGSSWASGNEKAIRKASLGFVALNALITVFYGAKHNLLTHDYWDRNREEILKLLLRDEELYELTQKCGYPTDFKELCKKLRDGSLDSAK